jgi:hypothetical protein
MHWTMPELYDLSQGDYNELVAWLSEKSKGDGEEEGLDVDALTDMDVNTQAAIVKRAMRG